MTAASIPQGVRPRIGWKSIKSIERKNPKMCSLLHVLLCLTTIALPVKLSAADLGSARHAYDEKDYVTALREVTPLATQGNADAQLLLGRMYLMGQGVTKDNDQASK